MNWERIGIEIKGLWEQMGIQGNDAEGDQENSSPVSRTQSS